MTSKSKGKPIENQLKEILESYLSKNFPNILPKPSVKVKINHFHIIITLNAKLPLNSTPPLPSNFLIQTFKNHLQGILINPTINNQLNITQTRQIITIESLINPNTFNPNEIDIILRLYKNKE